MLALDVRLNRLRADHTPKRHAPPLEAPLRREWPTPAAPSGAQPNLRNPTLLKDIGMLQRDINAPRGPDVAPERV